MKKLLAIVAILSLNGCALWDAYMMAPYDANEYMLITQIRVDAGQYKKQCDNPILAPVNAQAISAKTDLYEKYQEQIPRNANGKIMRHELSKKYKLSATNQLLELKVT